ncbi:MAG TPA: TIGR00282 family metallophosphoesterase [Candidatus Methylacidiphilales bacterium]|nr:TIGR00282 family metallophosphoesterase [Candidatus Methylacidiphilales bacterium]
MKLIFVGDVVGEPGRDTLRAAVPGLRERFSPDFFVVNGENAAGGNGITPRLAIDLMRAGADVITLGDHAWDQREIVPYFATEPRLLRPLNYPAGTPGYGSVVVTGNGKKLGVINALGRTFMGPQVDNPFLLIEAEIEKLKRETPHILIDFHAEATSEKIALGRAVDGLATLVVGTHTHVQTADDQIFPGGTAYLSDAGFCGSHESIIGRDIASVLQKYRTLLPNKFYIAREGLQADGVFVEADEVTGRAIRIERFQEKVKI